MTTTDQLRCPACKRLLLRHCQRCEWFRCPDSKWHYTYDGRTGQMVERPTGSNISGGADDHGREDDRR